MTGAVPNTMIGKLWGHWKPGARDNQSKINNLSRLRPARCKRRYREFVGGGARDQAGLTAVAQETAD